MSVRFGSEEYMEVIVKVLNTNSTLNSYWSDDYKTKKSKISMENVNNTNNKEIERYNYFRDHETIFGWAVNDSKNNKTVALVADKGYAKILADIMNAKHEEELSFAEDNKKYFDEIINYKGGRVE